MWCIWFLGVTLTTRRLEVSSYNSEEDEEEDNSNEQNSNENSVDLHSHLGKKSWEKTEPAQQESSWAEGRAPIVHGSGKTVENDWRNGCKVYDDRYDNCDYQQYPGPSYAGAVERGQRAIRYPPGMEIEEEFAAGNNNKSSPAGAGREDKRSRQIYVAPGGRGWYGNPSDTADQSGKKGGGQSGVRKSRINCSVIINASS